MLACVPTGHYHERPLQVQSPAPKGEKNPVSAEDLMHYNEKMETLTALFDKGALIKPPSLVDCTVSSGTQTKCLSITTHVSPADFMPGPWCPRHISDDKDKGGIWLRDGKVHDVDGEFVKNLDIFYSDTEWQMYDPATGKINVTNSKEMCEAAARPDVDPQYQNYCVECQTSYMRDDASITYVIPIAPTKQTFTSHAGPQGVGLSFSGIKYETSAPVHAILAAHTIAPFDDCGGHVNMHVGYHIHAVTGCTKEHTNSDHAPMIGIAMDGFTMHAQKNKNGKEPSDLDMCRGHKTEKLGYHYHVAEAGKNEIIPCFTGAHGCSLDDPNSVCNASIQKRRP